METNEISIHQVRVFIAARSAIGKWLTANQLAKNALVAPRTARHHAKRLLELGVFDMAAVFPGHRYKFNEIAEKRNKAYMIRLEKAIEVFQLINDTIGEN